MTAMAILGCECKNLYATQYGNQSTQEMSFQMWAWAQTDIPPSLRTSRVWSLSSALSRLTHFRLLWLIHLYHPLSFLVPCAPYTSDNSPYVILICSRPLNTPTYYHFNQILFQSYLCSLISNNGSSPCIWHTESY